MYSIEDYDGNGDCGMGNLKRSHDDAEGFSIALEAMNLPNTARQYWRKDAQCTASRWTGESAEINGVDFVFYAGHGWGCGPIFGCNPGYPINSIDYIRFGGGGYLKWVQAAACMWFVPEQEAICISGYDEFERWEASFKGVHAVMAHRARTWEHEFSTEMSEDFWKNWCLNGNELWKAWKDAQIKWIYEEAGFGIQPATLAPNQSYGTEKFAMASDDPAPYGAAWLAWSTVGTPIYW